jgi:hypothetical protein
LTPNSLIRNHLIFRIGGILVARLWHGNSGSQKGVAFIAVGAALLNRIGPMNGMVNDVRHEAANLAQGHAGHMFFMAVFRGSKCA